VGVTGYGNVWFPLQERDRERRSFATVDPASAPCGLKSCHLLEPVRLLKPMSIARSKAGCARFLTLIHSRHRPER